MAYDLFTHRHNFAAWAAARAAQRGFTNTENLVGALEQCGVCSFLRQPDSLSTQAEAFEALHRRWCSTVCQFLENRGVPSVTYGRAAKLIAVYLKAMVITGGHGESELARVVHPPVDRILLQQLARALEVHSPHKRGWRSTNWTELDAERYYALIAQLRVVVAEEPFWVLERYWTSTGG